MVRLASAVLGFLPTRIAVEIRERSRPLGRLDYPQAEIGFRLDSLTAYRRTMACSKEPETVEWIERCLQPGEVFYDIGANVGAYTLLAAALTGRSSTVVAFEPSFSNFAALCSNVELNRFGDRVIPLQLALADQNYLETFHYSTTVPGAALHRLGDEGGDFTSAFRQKVPVFRLDDLVERLSLPRPNHLKLDVDGPELAVLKGAGALLADPGLRTLLVEIDEGRPDAAEIFELLESNGWRAESRHPRGPTGLLFNVLFARPEPAPR